LFLAAGFLASPLLALDPSVAITQYGLSSWTTNDGLPQSSVSAIAQTRDGYLWFGTEEGLARFDGTRFAIFDKHSTPAFDGHNVNALLAARDGSLWIGGNGGLTRYKDGKFTSYWKREGLQVVVNSLAEGPDGSIWVAANASGVCRFHDGKFTSYTTSNGLPLDLIFSLFTAADGTLWIGTNGGGLSHFAHGTFTSYTMRDGLANNIVWAIHQDHAGDLWIGTNGGLNRLHNGHLSTFTTADGLTNNSVKVIRQDHDGNLWIGTDGGGLNRYSNGKFTSIDQKQGLSDNSVVALQEDLEGSLWVGTLSGGVNELRPGKFVTISKSEGLSTDVVWSVREARDGSLLIGTDNGFSRWKNGQMHTISSPGGLSSNVVRTVLDDRDGGLWIGTLDGLYHYDTHGKLTVFHAMSSGLSHDMIRSLAQDREGNIWIGTRGGGLNRLRDGIFTVFNTKNGLASNLLFSIDQDADGTLWIATSGGVSLLKDGRFRNYTTRDGLSSDTVEVTYEDHDGAHWIGTYGGGLNRIKGGHITPITAKDGLFDDVVYTILDDGIGYLWMTCNRGIFRVSKKELNDFADHKIQRVHSISYGVADGMKNTECNGGFPGGWKGTDGRLYFSTSGGVASIHPAHVRLNTVAPKVRIEEVLLDETRMPAAASLSVGPGRHSLEIHYTALSFLAPQKVAFRYRLRGFSPEWTEAGNRRVAFYTNLPPGNYVFEVMGSNNDGVWSTAGNPLAIVQQPHFYQTKWFTSVVAVLIVALLSLLYFLRVAALRRRQRMLERLVHERTEQLEATSDKNETILQSAAEGIVGIDASNVITFANNAARTTLGWDAEAVGQRLHPLIHPDIPIGDCAICEPRGSGTQTNAVLFRSGDGRTIPVDVTSSALRKGFGAVVTFRDASERVAIEQMKDEFVATVSHELRTPLTAIRGAVGLVGHAIKGSVGEKVHRMIEIATNNCDRMLRMVNELLDSERLVSGRIELRVDRFDVASVMNQAVALMQPIGEKNGVHVLAEPFSHTIEADGDRIIQVITNLIGNAVKFSPREGSVRLTGEVRGAEVRFHVTDEGRGIPKEKLQTVFERFRQVESSDAHDKGGSGLGLAICRGIVEAHRGRIWVESELGSGSTFSFSVPIHQENLADATAAPMLGIAS
jgi:PAS domain S-box-containing protein